MEAIVLQHIKIEDPGYIKRVELASEQMAACVPPMVESAKSLARNITHPGRIADWRGNTNKVSDLHQIIQTFVPRYIYTYIYVHTFCFLLICSWTYKAYKR